MQNNDQHTHTEPLLWDINQTAAAMGLSVHTLYQWVSQKRIPYAKVGRRVMFDPKDIQAWIEANKVQPMELKQLLQR